MSDDRDNAWAVAQHLERLLLNARGALRQGELVRSDIEFRAALLTATAHVIAELAPPSDDTIRQAEYFAKILAEQLRGERARPQQHTLTERLMAEYQGPEIA